MQVDVTQQDLVSGIRKHACECAVSLAIKRKLGLKEGVQTAKDVVIVSPIGKDPQYYYPKDAKAFSVWLSRFDKGENLEPVSFEFVKEDASMLFRRRDEND